MSCGLHLDILRHNIPNFQALDSRYQVSLLLSFWPALFPFLLPELLLAISFCLRVVSGMNCGIQQPEPGHQLAKLFCHPLAKKPVLGSDVQESLSLLLSTGILPPR